MKKSTFLKTALFSLTAMAAFTQTAFANTTNSAMEVITVEAGKIYSEAHRKSIGKQMEKVRYQNGNIEMVGNIYFPENFDKTKTYPAVIVGHPGGGKSKRVVYMQNCLLRKALLRLPLMPLIKAKAVAFLAV